MAASHDTVRQIITVLEEYIPNPKRRRQLAAALYERVTGNASVRKTLQALRNQTTNDHVQQREGEDE